MRSQYLRLFRWHVLRYVAQHRLLATLNILSVALGVAVYLAIQIANQSANRAFAASIDLVAGKAHLQVIAQGGELTDESFPLIARHRGISAATPLVRGLITLPNFPGEYLEILGIDIFTNSSFRTFDLTGFPGGQFDLQRWLGEANSIALTEEFARRHGLKEGDPIRAQVNGANHALRVSFIIRTQGNTLVDSHFAAMDIGWAQELFARRGALSAVQLRLTNLAERDRVIAELRTLLPPNATIGAPAQRGEEVEKMLGGFQLNLTAMSLVSLLVGMFLIYNTVAASVVRRRGEIGILRSLGVTRKEVHALFLGEALFLGCAGAFVGLAAGLLLARLLIGAVSETISSLYLLVSVRELALTPWMFGIAWSAGVASVLVAAWLPARAAARMDPVQALGRGTILERSVRLSIFWWIGGVASLVLAAGFSFVALATGPPWISFAAAFFILLGFSLLTPSIASRLTRDAGRALRWRRRHSGPLLEPELAATNLARSLFRNSVTIAALAVALAMTIGVSVMVFSFRQTVRSWIDGTLSADLFIAPASNEITGASSFIPREAIRFLEELPGVADVDTFRAVELRVGEANVDVAVVRGSNRRHFRFLRGNHDAIMRRFHGEECVLVSESFARRRRVRDGDTLKLPTPGGLRSFSIAGTFYDYTRDQGIVYLSRQNFMRFWNDDRVHSLAIYLEAGAAGETVAERFREKFSDAGEFAVYSNRDLRRRVFEIFDQTFAVTYVLRTIAVIVAIAGVFLTLTTIVTERAREIAVLRAIGASAAQIRRLLLWECAMLGGLAAAIGLASGICLALVLTGVVNRAFFGWTIQLALPWLSLAVMPVWIVAAALVAGLAPAWRASRSPVAEALRNE